MLGKYYQRTGMEVAREFVGGVLVSTLIWFPLFVPVSAMGWGVMPVSNSGILPPIVIIMGWVLGSFWGMLKYDPSTKWRVAYWVALGVSVIVTLGGAFVLLNQPESFTKVIVILVVFVEVVILTSSIVHNKPAKIQRVVYCAVFLVAFFVAYFVSLGVPMTEGWYGGGYAPVALHKAFFQIFGTIAIVAITSALSVALDILFLNKMDNTMFPVMFGLGIGLGIFSSDRLLTPYGLDIMTSGRVIFYMPFLVLLGAYIVVTITGRILVMSAKRRCWINILRLIMVSVLIFSFAMLVQLCWLNGWQVYVLDWRHMSP